MKIGRRQASKRPQLQGPPLRPMLPPKRSLMPRSRNLARGSRFPRRPKLLRGWRPTIVQDNARKLNKNVTAGKIFVLELCPKLMTSAQPTVLAGRQQDFFIFELAPGTLQLADFEASLTTSAEQNQDFQAPLPVRLSNLRIDQKTIDGTFLSGSVAYRVSGPTSGKLAMRLTVMLGKSTKTMYQALSKENLSGEGTARFHFKSLYTEQSRPSGLVVFFLDLAAMDESGPRVRALVLSNDLAALVVAQKVNLPKGPS